MSTQNLIKDILTASHVSLTKIVVLFFIVVASLTVNYLHAAWTAPSAAFPGGNVDIPINIGSDSQNKAGLLGASTMVTQDFQVGSDAVPDTLGVLMADINGNIGAAQYCDQDGNNCTAATDLGGSNSFNEIEVGTDVSPDTPGVLAADVNGNIGAAQYCDQDGNNCTAATDLGGSGNLMIEQGVVTRGSGETDEYETVYFTQPFTAPPYIILQIEYYNYDNGCSNDSLVFRVDYTNLTQDSVRIRKDGSPECGGSGSQVRRIRWTAIGA